MRRFYNLPSLTSLATFEAAARHMSFKRAAEELNVTPGAVSRQIKFLEEELGRPLFIRHSRGVIMTDDGQSLYAVLSRMFDETSKTFEAIRHNSDDQKITIGCSTAFAQQWLMPRIAEFWSDHPDLVINHVISDNQQDMRFAEVDLRVRYGNGQWSDEVSQLMFEDEIIAVSSPDLAKKIGPVRHLDDFANHILIDLSVDDPEWTRWQDWLGRLGYQGTLTKRRNCNNYVIAIQLAQAGHGIALGWRKLVSPLLETGALVQISDFTDAAPYGYFLTWNRHQNLSQPCRELITALLNHSD